MDKTSLQMLFGVLLGVFLLALIVMTVVYVRRKLADKREEALRDLDLMQEEAIREEQSQSKGYWINRDDIEDENQAHLLRYYHYFDNIDECIHDLIVEMYDCGFVRTEEIFVAAYGEEALTPDSFIYMTDADCDLEKAKAALPPVSEKNQKIIADALEKLNYQENKVARILASGQTEFVGVIIPNLFLHYYSEMLDRILSTYETFGYKFLVFLSNGDADTERQYIQELLAYKIEGLIILSHAIPSMELANLHIPIVAIEREDAHISSINTDNYMGAIQATSLLYRHNCEVLFHINNPTAKSIPAYGRIEGFEDFCREQQIPHRIFLHEMKDQTASQEHLKEILSEIEADSPGRKKGIFVSNDTHASILVNLLVRKYGKLPEDYLIVGFDDSPASRNAIFPISTVAQQIDVLATEAVKLLVEQIEEHKNSKHTPVSEPVHKMITPVLIRRETTERDLLAEDD